MDERRSYTVSWRIRIFSCTEEVPRFFFPIEFNPIFQIPTTFNSTVYHTQFNFLGSNPGMALHHGVPLDWSTVYCNKEFFKGTQKWEFFWPRFWILYWTLIVMLKYEGFVNRIFWLAHYGGSHDYSVFNLGQIFF
jgi:hypothetical protein